MRVQEAIDQLKDINPDYNLVCVIEDVGFRLVAIPQEGVTPELCKSISKELKRKYKQGIPSSKGKCAHCGKPVHHAYPWYTGTPERGGKPVHDECAGPYGLYGDKQ